MKVTVDVPEPLYRRLKARAAQEGRTVREVTVELYERWLAGSAVTESERHAAAERWLDGWHDLAHRIEETTVDDESAVEWLIGSRR